MILDPARVVSLVLSPAHSASLAEGRALERRHRLHIEAPEGLFKEWVTKNFSLGTPLEQTTMEKLAVPITKTKFGPFIDAISKVFTARGTSYYYEFSRPDDQQDFEQYLTETKLKEKLQGRFLKASLTGFQGVFLVDLPSEPNPEGELPRPYVQYMPSSLIHDAEVKDNAYEYIIFSQTQINTKGEEETYYVCYDEQTAHVVVPTGNADRYRVDSTRSVIHGLGYVPAFAPSLYAARDDNETVRTSIFDRAIPIADDYQRDYNNRVLSKHYHAFQKFWAYGTPCDWQWNIKVEPTCVGEAEFVLASCGGHGQYVHEGRTHTCPHCQGKGVYVPVGPDKTWVLKVPEGPGAPDIRPPAGYIVPDVDTWKQQGEDLQELSRALEVAALSKEGITSTNTKQETALAKQLDTAQVNGRRDDYGDNWKHVLQSCVDTVARLRYDSSFMQSAINIGRKYDELSLSEQEARYKEAKMNGTADSILFGYLEDLVYTRYNNDPVELEYNRLKLYLEPVPTRSTSEVEQWLKERPNDPELISLFRRKRNLNDYVARFEQENGSIVQFGIRVRFEERITRIKEAFDLYDKEVQSSPNPSTVNPTPNANFVSA